MPRATEPDRGDDSSGLAIAVVAIIALALVILVGVALVGGAPDVVREAAEDRGLVEATPTSLAGD